MAIRCDGRLIRHCTSVTRLDGREGSHVAYGGEQIINHVYGAFTAAKERIVHAGCKRAALLREKKELTNDGNKIEFHVEDEREELSPYNPTIKEADPHDDLVLKDEGDWDWHWATMKKSKRNAERKLESEKQGGDKPANVPAPDLDAPLSYDGRRIVASQLHRMQTPQPTAMVDVPTSGSWDSYVIPKKRQ
jgi:hypothetical protein